MSIAEVSALGASRRGAPTQVVGPGVSAGPFAAATLGEDDPHRPLAAPARSPGVATSVALFLLAALALGFVVNLVLVSRLEHQVAQTKAFNLLRYELAQGTAPIGPRDADHELLALGTPMAVLDIPSIGLKEVVGEGTTSAVLMTGPGHERSTVFPGGAGTSVILGRAASYDGPFGRIHELRTGAVITVTTGVGTSTFRVVDRRTAGDVIPHLARGGARLTLATATGPAFVPSGVLWVDANLVGTPLAAAKPAVSALPGSELPLGIDTGACGSCCCGWGRSSWSSALRSGRGTGAGTPGRGSSSAAPAAVVSLFIAGQITLLLPNLL